MDVLAAREVPHTKSAHQTQCAALPPGSPGPELAVVHRQDADLRNVSDQRESAGVLQKAVSLTIHAADQVQKACLASWERHPDIISTPSWVDRSEEPLPEGPSASGAASTGLAAAPTASPNLRLACTYGLLRRDPDMYARAYQHPWLLLAVEYLSAASGVAHVAIWGLGTGWRLDASIASGAYLVAGACSITLGALVHEGKQGGPKLAIISLAALVGLLTDSYLILRYAVAAVIETPFRDKCAPPCRHMWPSYSWPATQKSLSGL